MDRQAYAQERNLDLQLDTSSKTGIKKKFTDQVLGGKSEKPHLNELLNYARSGDTLGLWRLDRLDRTTGQLIRLIEELNKKEYKFSNLKQLLLSFLLGNMVIDKISQND